MLRWPTPSGSSPPKPKRSRGSWVPYALLAPGLLWLAMFFIVPTFSSSTPRCRQVRASTGYQPGLNISDLHRRDLAVPRAVLPVVLLRRPGHVADPAHRLSARLHDRLQVRPVEELHAGARHRAVLHQLPDPDAGLADHPVRRRRSSPRSSPPSTSPNLLELLHLTSDGRLLGTPFAVIMGLTYNFLPFMTLPLVRQPRPHRPAADRGSGRPLLLAVHRVPQGDLAAVPAWCRRGHAADLHPRGR